MPRLVFLSGLFSFAMLAGGALTLLGGYGFMRRMVDNL